MQSNERNLLLDLLRGLAALLVCMSHLRAATLVEWQLVQSAGAANRALYFVTGVGSQAVVVFFVISGYLVGGSLMNRPFVWREYASARLGRLWTVLLPCLVVTLLADAATWHLRPDILSGGFTARWNSTPVSGAYSASPLTFLGNVLFLQTIAVPVLGSNGPLWSLANEFWYYVLFPVLLVVISRGGNLRRRGIAVVSLTVLMLLLPLKFMPGFLAWLMGAAVSRLHSRGVQAGRGWPAGAACALLLLTTFVCWKIFPTAPGMQIGIGIATAGLVYFAPTVRELRFARPIEHLADMSFSLYLSHFPIVLLIGAAFAGSVNRQPTWAGWVQFGAALTVILAIAHLMWWLFERHTRKVQMALRQWWRRPGSLTASP